MKKIFTLLFFIVSISLSQWTPKRDTTIILPVGDSHTEGSGTMGWRDIFHNLDSLGYKVKTVGNRKTNYISPNTSYGTTVPITAQFHQGITGISANTYKALIADTMNINLHGRYKNIPHIVLLWIGTNDIANGSYSTTTIINNISTMIDSIHAVDPLIRVLVVDVIPFWRTRAAYTQARFDSINAVNLLFPAMVAEKVADDKYVKLIHIDTTTITTDSNYYQNDGIHISNKGNHDVIIPTFLPYITQAIDTVFEQGDRYFTYYEDWCMGNDAQWSLSNGYMSTRSFIANMGKVTDVILFHTRDNVDTTTSPYFMVAGEYPSSTDSINYFFNGVANPGAGYADWISRGSFYDLRDSLHANGRRILVEVQSIEGKRMSHIIMDSAKTEVFTDTLASFIYRNNFDGVSHDIELSNYFDSTSAQRYFRILRDKIPNKIITIDPIPTQKNMYGWKSSRYIDKVLPQHYQYAINDDPACPGNSVFHNSPLYLTDIPVGSNHQALIDVNPYASYTQPWSAIDWVSSGWEKDQMVILLSTEANPFTGVDTLFGCITGGKPFWQDSMAYLMTLHGGTYYFDDVHIGGYVAGISDTTVSAHGGTIDSAEAFIIPVLALQAIDSIVAEMKYRGYNNYGLYNTSTDSRILSGGDKFPIHNRMSSLLSIGIDSIVTEVSGNSQSALFNTTLSAFLVNIVDEFGFGIPDVTVTFAITSTPSGASGQSLSSATVLTDADGNASSILTLGNKKGTYTVTATPDVQGESPITFTATATANTRTARFYTR